MLLLRVQVLIAGGSAERCAQYDTPATNKSYLVDVSPGADHTAVQETMHFPRVVRAVDCLHPCYTSVDCPRPCYTTVWHSMHRNVWVSVIKAACFDMSRIIFGTAALAAAHPKRVLCTAEQG